MNKKITRPGFIKRLAVVIYDALLLAGVLFFCLVITFGSMVGFGLKVAKH